MNGSIDFGQGYFEQDTQYDPTRFVNDQHRHDDDNDKYIEHVICRGVALGSQWAGCARFAKEKRERRWRLMMASSFFTYLNTEHIIIIRLIFIIIICGVCWLPAMMTLIIIMVVIIMLMTEEGWG